jgi:hypothetical protein
MQGPGKLFVSAAAGAKTRIGRIELAPRPPRTLAADDIYWNMDITLHNGHHGAG